jgi:multimeric flavodoxin WrbA
MLIVAINGSPNQDGNTADLLQNILATIPGNEAETCLLHATEILEESGPIICKVCATPCPGTCYKNTRLEEAFAILAKADAIILGSPVYFGTVATPLKAFFDKTRKLRREKKLFNTIGAAVAVGAARFGGQETTLRALHDIMLVHGMVVVGDGDISTDCGHHGVCAQRPASQDVFAKQRSRSIAFRVLQVAQATQSLR